MILVIISRRYWKKNRVTTIADSIDCLLSGQKAEKMSSPPSSSKARHPSQKDDYVADTELSALLDSALGDFGRLKNTDDEIDSMMENMDQEAAQKAASNFDSLLKNLSLNAANQQSAEVTNQPESSTPQTPMTEEERRAAENFQKMLKTLVEAEEKTLSENRAKPEAQPSEAEAAEASAFLQQLKNLAEQDPTHLTDEAQMEPLMNLMQSFFAKDLMYPSIKQLYDNFPGYLEKHPELEAEKRQNYEKQIDVLKRICDEYEKEDNSTGENAELTRNRFETISMLMVELQSYGYPPEELVGITPPGWSVDPASGLPTIEDVSKASESCNLM